MVRSSELGNILNSFMPIPIAPRSFWIAVDVWFPVDSKKVNQVESAECKLDHSLIWIAWPSNLRFHPWDIRDSHRSNIIVVMWTRWCGIRRKIVCIQPASSAPVAFHDVKIVDLQKLQHQSDEEAGDTSSNDADFARVRLIWLSFSESGSCRQVIIVLGASIVEFLEKMLVQDVLRVCGSDGGLRRGWIAGYLGG